MQRFWPVIGFVLAVSLIALAYALAPSTLLFLKKNLKNFPPITDQLKLFMTFILFLIFLAVTGFAVAIAMPKKKSAVSEKDMVNERKDMVAAKAARKKRQQDINRQMKSR
jgi:hypothetical protein